MRPSHRYFYKLTLSAELHINCTNKLKQKNAKHNQAVVFSSTHSGPFSERYKTEFSSSFDFHGWLLNSITVRQSFNLLWFIVLRFAIDLRFKSTFSVVLQDFAGGSFMRVSNTVVDLPSFWYLETLDSNMWWKYWRT